MTWNSTELKYCRTIVGKEVICKDKRMTFAVVSFAKITTHLSGYGQILSQPWIFVNHYNK